MSSHHCHRFTLTLRKVCPQYYDFYVPNSKGNLVAKPSKHVVLCTQLPEQGEQINPAWPVVAKLTA